MIDYFQNQRLSSIKKIPKDVLEKDYFIEILLFYLSNNDYFRNITIFRGGTSLRKVYFSEYRFSEDLDFVIKEEENLKLIDKTIDEVLQKISDNFPFALLKLRVLEVKDSRLLLNMILLPRSDQKKN